MTTDLSETVDLLRLLAWYRDMGVDAITAEAPIDWRARPEAGPGAAFQWPLRPERTLNPPAREPLGDPSAGTSRTSAGATQSSMPSLPPRSAPSTSPPPKQGRPPPAGFGSAPVSPSAPARAFSTAAPDDAVLAARTLAAAAKTLDELRSALSAFDGCGLKATAKNLCFSRGADRARLMVIGEAPGREEDAEGRPLIGVDGTLLDRMLAAIGCSETDTHITNIVYWRPPGNRTPTPQEANVCRPFLERQIELVQPARILLLGGATAKHILDTPDSIQKLRGKWRTFASVGGPIDVMATFHPSYLRRTPAAKRQTWADLIELKRALAGS